MSKPSHPRVKWSAREKQQIVERAVELRFEQPKLTRLALFREAMRVLPASRRRVIYALAQVPWFESDLQARLSVTNGDLAALARQVATNSEALVLARQLAKNTQEALDR